MRHCMNPASNIMPEPFNEEHLSAYLDGELPAAERLAVEDWIKSDPAMQRALEEMRAVRDELQQFFQQQSFSLPNPAAFSDEVVRRAERAALRAGDSVESNAADQPAPSSNGEVHEPDANEVTPASSHAATTWRSNLPALFTAAAAVIVLALLIVPQFFQTTNVAVVPAEQPPEINSESDLTRTGETQGQPSAPGTRQARTAAGPNLERPTKANSLDEEELTDKAGLNFREDPAPLPRDAYQLLKRNDRSGGTDSVKSAMPGGPKPLSMQPLPKGHNIGGGGFGGELPSNAAGAALRLSAVKEATFRVETLRRGKFVDAVNQAVGEDIDLQQALASGEYELFIVTHQPQPTTSAATPAVDKQDASDEKQSVTDSEVASLSRSLLQQVSGQIEKQRSLDRLRDRNGENHSGGRKNNYRRAISAPRVDISDANSKRRFAAAGAQSSNGTDLKTRVSGASAKSETEEYFQKGEPQSGAGPQPAQHAGNAADAPKDAPKDASENAASDSPQRSKFRDGKSDDSATESSWFADQVPGDNVKLLIADASAASAIQLDQALMDLKATSVELQKVKLSEREGMATFSSPVEEAVPLVSKPPEFAKQATNQPHQLSPGKLDAAPFGAPAADAPVPLRAPAKPKSAVATEPDTEAPAPELSPAMKSTGHSSSGDAKPQEAAQADAQEAESASQQPPPKNPAAMLEPSAPRLAKPEPVTKPTPAAKAQPTAMPKADEPAAAKSPMAETTKLDDKPYGGLPEQDQSQQRKSKAGRKEPGADKAAPIEHDEDPNGSNLKREEPADRPEAKKQLALKQQQPKPVQFFLLIRRKPPRDTAP